MTAETVTDNENKNLSDNSVNGIETLEDDETEELKKQLKKNKPSPKILKQMT